jgi:hypothetical protein
MKRIICMILLANLVMVARSQTEKGRFIYGGSVMVNNQFATPSIGLPNFFSATLAPQFGYFPVKNLAIMGRLSIGYAGDFKTNSNWNYGFGPELRYYVGKSNIKFYAFTYVVPSGSSVRVLFETNTYDSRNFVLSTGTGGGLAIFPNHDFAVNIGLSFNTFSSFRVYPAGPPTVYDNVNQFSVGLNVSFNGLFSLKPKEKK